jgi:hypothetical protein
VGCYNRITNAPNLSSKDGLSKEIENREQEQQEQGFELWCEDILGERGKWRARGAPHHATARPSMGHATMWCGGMVGPPEVSQVPLCPIFDIKEFSENFRETLFSRIF